MIAQLLMAIIIWDMLPSRIASSDSVKLACCLFCSTISCFLPHTQLTGSAFLQLHSWPPPLDIASDLPGTSHFPFSSSTTSGSASPTSVCLRCSGPRPAQRCQFPDVVCYEYWLLDFLFPLAIVHLISPHILSTLRFSTERPCSWSECLGSN